MPIRIIILCYKRWGNVNAIVKALHKYFPITVINNLEGHTYTNPDAEVINNDANRFCMERWLKCYSYPEPFKLILDDFLSFWYQNDIFCTKKNQRNS